MIWPVKRQIFSKTSNSAFQQSKRYSSCRKLTCCSSLRIKIKRRSRQACRVTGSLYGVLQIDESATKEEVRAAYRRLAGRFHPDVDSSPAAQQKLEAVCEAYYILSNDSLRSLYDTNGVTPASIFRAEEYKAPVNGDDVMVVVSLDFLEAALGKQHTVEVDVKRPCPECVGLGAAPGSHPVFCSLCRGQGYVRTAQADTGRGIPFWAGCPGCGATGVVRREWCSRCGGEGLARIRVSVNVCIPAGVDGESVLKYQSQGDAGLHGGQPGDLYLTFVINPREGINRMGLDIFSEVVVRYTDAILGGCLTVQTIHGEVQLYVPPGTQDGDRLTVPGAGISPGAALLAGLSEQRQLGAGYSHRGAHHYAVTLLIPAQVTEKERQILQELQERMRSNSSI